MKKKIFYGLLIFLVVGLISCKKDKDDDPYSTPYSELTVEQNKENVEQEGIEFVDELKDFDPLTDSIVFSEKPIKIDLSKKFNLKINEDIFKLEIGENEIPTYLAIFLIARKLANIL